MALISINGVEMPMPNSYSIPMDDVESGDSARSESGVLVRNRVRQGLFQLDLSWRVPGDQAATNNNFVQKSLTVDTQNYIIVTYKTACRPLFRGICHFCADI